MKILYGLPKNQLDITNKILSHFVRQNIAIIPKGDDDRAYLFTDPLPRILKVVTIITDDSVETIIDHTRQAYMDLSTQKIYMDNIPSYIKEIYPYDLDEASNAVIENKLKEIHTTLKLVHGSMTQEFPEQGMAMRFLTGKEKVLEIGANVGRNSLMIQSILSKGNPNFVTLESDAGIASQLKENRDANHMNFQIEASALSKRKLIQRVWDTIVSDEVLPGYHSVQTITLEELRNKYKINFDTLILDCEGAFYYILMDMPDILDNINLIIMENDYYNETHKAFIDEAMTKKGLKRVYVQNGGWECRYYNKFPNTYMNFFEVWQK